MAVRTLSCVSNVLAMTSVAITEWKSMKPSRGELGLLASLKTAAALEIPVDNLTY